MRPRRRPSRNARAIDFSAAPTTADVVAWIYKVNNWLVAQFTSPVTLLSLPTDWLIDGDPPIFAQQLTPNTILMVPTSNVAGGEPVLIPAYSPNIRTAARGFVRQATSSVTLQTTVTDISPAYSPELNHCAFIFDLDLAPLYAADDLQAHLSDFRGCTVNGQSPIAVNAFDTNIVDLIFPIENVSGLPGIVNPAQTFIRFDPGQINTALFAKSSD